MHGPVFLADPASRSVWIWHDLGLSGGVAAFRKHVTRALIGVAILFTALISVGLTAPADGPFTLAIHPVFLRMDPTALPESRARALGVDVDVTLGPLHLHAAWSAIPLAQPSTEPGSSLF